MTEMNKSEKKKKHRINRTVLNIFLLLFFYAAVFLLYRSGIPKLVEEDIDDKNTIETDSQMESVFDSSASVTEEVGPSSGTIADSTAVPAAGPAAPPTQGPGIYNPSPSETTDPVPTPTSTHTPEPAAPAQSPVPTPMVVKNEGIPQRKTLDRSQILPYFNSLLDTNEDIRGFIEIPGTNISYPVVQGIDNEFYLERNIYGKKTVSASIFMDYRNNTKKLDDNTIIYGHNLRRTMFNDLDYFVDKSTRDAYMEAGGVFRFDTAYKAMSWEIYSAYIVDKDDFNYLTTNFASEGLHRAFLEETMERSFVDTGIIVTTDDRILTLSTCNHWYFDSRTVIHARLINNR